MVINFVGCACKTGKFILFKLEVSKSISRVFQVFVLQKRPRIATQTAKCSQIRTLLNNFHE